jgi:molybdopterin/thiamine biosynthesis adenylyltransferase
MDYTRQRAWFDPSTTNAAVTIVGCGGIGSFAAFALAKLGIQTLELVDFDTVEQHNIPNQLFTSCQVGHEKVAAVADFVIQHNDSIAVTGHSKPLQDGIPRSAIVISALDSMAARAELWKQVRYKLDVKLFLDGRLGGEHVVLYSVDPSNPTDVTGYEATLHSDTDGDDLPCTARSIIDVGFAVGSLITRAVRRHYAHEPATPTVYLNQQTLDIFKGGWPT